MAAPNGNSMPGLSGLDGGLSLGAAGADESGGAVEPGGVLNLEASAWGDDLGDDFFGDDTDLGNAGTATEPGTELGNNLGTNLDSSTVDPAAGAANSCKTEEDDPFASSSLPADKVPEACNT